MARVDRAQELREARELFLFAMREGVDMATARQRIKAEQWKAAEARLAAKRCGTQAASIGSVEDEAERPLPFYLQGQYA